MIVSFLNEIPLRDVAAKLYLDPIHYIEEKGRAILLLQASKMR